MLVGKELLDNIKNHLKTIKHPTPRLEPITYRQVKEVRVSQQIGRFIHCTTSLHLCMQIFNDMMC